MLHEFSHFKCWEIKWMKKYKILYFFPFHEKKFETTFYEKAKRISSKVVLANHCFVKILSKSELCFVLYQYIRTVLNRSTTFWIHPKDIHPPSEPSQINRNLTLAVNWSARPKWYVSIKHFWCVMTSHCGCIVVSWTLNTTD